MASPPLATFKQYYALAGQLIEQASKEDLAECARLLAINLAHYESRYGGLPLEETLAALNAEMPNEGQLEMLTRGMENFLGVLGSVIGGMDQEKH